MGRSILAVVLGIVLGMVTIFAWEMVGHVIYPLPPGVDPHDPKTMHTLVEKMPAGAILILLVGWFTGTAAGGWLAARLAQRVAALHALIVGGFFMTGAIAIMLHIPHPLWIWVAALLGFLPAAYWGAWIAGRGVGSSHNRVSLD
jgi:hypothetical protein